MNVDTNKNTGGETGYTVKGYDNIAINALNMLRNCKYLEEIAKKRDTLWRKISISTVSN